MSNPGNDENDFDKHQMVPVIHEYRGLIGGVAPTSDQEEINAFLPQADELYRKVIEHKSTRGAHLDAIFLRKVSTATYQNSRNINVDNRFEPKEFAQKLITRLTGRRNDSGGDVSEDSWTQLGDAASQCFKRAVPFHFMLGSFDRGPRIKKPNASGGPKNNKDESGPLTKPDRIHEGEKSHQERTTEAVEKVLGVLKQITKTEDGEEDEISPVNFFEFVVDPDSFSHTVENIFHLSFLIKDGHACIELDEDQLPIVYPTSPYTQTDQREKVKRKQLVMSMSLEEWKEIIQTFEITSSVIPPMERTPRKTPSKSRRDKR